MDLLDSDLIWPIAGATLAGAIIGAEREYRASPASLRTHILVSLSCCLLMLSAVHQMAWLNDAPVDVIRIDPVHMAHGILTGIGFYQLAIFGGVVTFAVLAAVSVTECYAPQRRIVHIRATYRRGSAMTLGGFEELLEAKSLKSITIDQALDGDRHSFTAIAGGYTESCAEALA